MSWISLILISLIIAGISLWLNAKFNVREKNLRLHEKKLNQKEESIHQEKVQRQANLDENYSRIRLEDNALKQRQVELNNHAKWLQEQEARMQKIHEDMEAKIKSAYEERDSSRQRAKRLQEEIKTLKGKFSENKTGDLITP